MGETADFLLLTFTSLFALINPLGILPPYLSLTDEFTPSQKRAIARKGVITAFVILIGFSLTGQFIFAFFGISVDSLRIVGGIILFFIGYEMMQARFNRPRHDDESPVEYASDIAITPLAIPIISGPGAIATAIVLSESAPSPVAWVGFACVIALILIITWSGLISAERIMNILGDNGNKVLMRIMGLLVMVIAVEFFFAGLTPKVQQMLMLN